MEASDSTRGSLLGSSTPPSTTSPPGWHQAASHVAKVTNPRPSRVAKPPNDELPSSARLPAAPPAWLVPAPPIGSQQHPPETGLDGAGGAPSPRPRVSGASGGCARRQAGGRAGSPPGTQRSFKAAAAPPSPVELCRCPPWRGRRWSRRWSSWSTTPRWWPTPGISTVRGWGGQGAFVANAVAGVVL